MNQPESQPLVADKAVLPLELFFDLVFVLGITQTVALVIEGHDGQALYRAGLVLGMLWWGWTQFTWTANSIDLRSAGTRIVFFVAMGAALIMAVSVPTAFGEGGLWIAVGYLVVRAIGVWLQLIGTTDPETRASVRVWAAVSWVGPVVLLIGGFADPSARSWIWPLGLLLELGAAGLVGGRAWRISVSHFAERHGLIYIIALGEGIIAVGMIASGVPFESTIAVTMLLAIAAASALWWSYFDGFSEVVEHGLRSAGDFQGIMARDAYSTGHYPMIAGIVLFAAAAEEIVLHPGDPLSGFARVLVALSVGLALLTQAVVNKRAGGSFLIERASAAFLIALLMIPSMEVKANLVFLVVVMLVVAALSIERTRGRMVSH